MGKRKARSNNVKHEMYLALSAMYEKGKGRSRHEDKANGVDAGRIYAQKTYHDYKDIAYGFATFLKNTHPDVRHMKQGKQYVDEYLLYLMSLKRSSFTIATRKAALAKLYGTTSNEFIETPSRLRADIARSRQKVDYDRHLSEEKRQWWGRVTSNTGLRISELTRVTGNDLFYDGEKYFLAVTKGTKGGKKRYAEILDNWVVELLKEAGDKAPFAHPPKAFDNHSYRAEYAKKIYEKYARPIDDVPRSERYDMRLDKAGVHLDKKAMEIASKSLGHNRIQVIAESYLYDLTPTI